MGEKFTFRTKKTGGDFKLPPEGTYDFLIKDWKAQDPTDEGAPRFFLQLEIADGPHAGSEIRDYHTLDEKQGWKMRVILEQTGTDFEMDDEDDASNEATFTFDPDDVLGRYFRADLTHYKSTNTKKVYPNFNDVRVSPLQEAASGGTAPGGTDAQDAPKGAPQGTARPRPSR